MMLVKNTRNNGGPGGRAPWLDNNQRDVCNNQRDVCNNQFFKNNELNKIEKKLIIKFKNNK